MKFCNSPGQLSPKSFYLNVKATHLQWSKAPAGLAFSCFVHSPPPVSSPPLLPSTRRHLFYFQLLEMLRVFLISESLNLLFLLLYYSFFLPKVRKITSWLLQVTAKMHPLSVTSSLMTPRTLMSFSVLIPFVTFHCPPLCGSQSVIRACLCVDCLICS